MYYVQPIVQYIVLDFIGVCIVLLEYSCHNLITLKHVYVHKIDHDDQGLTLTHYHTEILII